MRESGEHTYNMEDSTMHAQSPEKQKSPYTRAYIGPVMDFLRVEGIVPEGVSVTVAEGKTWGKSIAKSDFDFNEYYKDEGNVDEIYWFNANQPGSGIYVRYNNMTEIRFTDRALRKLEDMRTERHNA